jgi:hypothetical protein
LNQNQQDKPAMDEFWMTCPSSIAAKYSEGVPMTVRNPPWPWPLQRLPADEVERLRAALLNIQAMAERGFPIDCAKLAEQCRRALNP